MTEHVEDPVELLMKVQLGGGTDIGLALQYGLQQIASPHRGIVVLITDLFEGGETGHLVRQVRAAVQDGIKVLVLAALDADAAPCFDHDMGGKLVAVGAEVAAMTPGELAMWLAEKIQS